MRWPCICQKSNRQYNSGVKCVNYHEDKWETGRGEWAER